MAESSDAIIKRQIFEEVGHSFNDITLRIFNEGSNQDQQPFSKGGLTFGANGIYYGSCDAVWLIEGDEFIDRFDNKKISSKPIIALEGTDALQRGSSGNAQYQRFHHALGAVKNGIIGIYYLRPGRHAVQPDLYGMACNASRYEDGVYLITQDLNQVKTLLELISTYGLESTNVTNYINEFLKDMQEIYDNAFEVKYNSDWEVFARRRSTVFLDNDIIIKHAGRCLRNFTESSQRAGHIAVGEMFLSKYFFTDKTLYYLFPRMTHEDLLYLNTNLTIDKEWCLLQNEPNVIIKTMDDLQGLPNNLRDELISLQDKPLKGKYITNYNSIVRQIVVMIKSGQIVVL